VFETKRRPRPRRRPAGAPRDDLVLTQLETELQRTKEQLQETIEHSEISTEELRASNEELQAINEELRSATEELETSKEELQSVNEELITVNYELKVKVEETGKANDDLNNLIASTDIATVFVDSGLRIKRFTPRATDIFSVIASDLGRSLLDLTHRLDYDELADDVSATFETLRPVEREVRSTDGRWYIVRLLPYRTTEDRIEGAMMTFFDITARRQAEEQARVSEARMRMVAESTNDYAIITMDADGRVTSWNKGAERMFGYPKRDAGTQTLDILFTPEDRERGARDDEMRARPRRRPRPRTSAGTCARTAAVSTAAASPRRWRAAPIRLCQDRARRDRAPAPRSASATRRSPASSARTGAEHAAALKDEFLAIMSHELRQPLNMIGINATCCRACPKCAPRLAARCAETIRSSVISQAKIIDDLLDLSRVRTGKLALSVAPVHAARWSAPSSTPRAPTRPARGLLIEATPGRGRPAS
jgi:two-component system CheB/CheR fusion protein